jgi:hypothetical protein
MCECVVGVCALVGETGEVWGKFWQSPWHLALWRFGTPSQPGAKIMPSPPLARDSLLAISSSPRGAPRALSGRNKKQVRIYLSLGVISSVFYM